MVIFLLFVGGKRRKSAGCLGGCLVRDHVIDMISPLGIALIQYYDYLSEDEGRYNQTDTWSHYLGERQEYH